MVKATGANHRLFQATLPGMAERRMAQIMGQTKRLGQILVQTQRSRDGAPNLGHLNAVRQADPKMVSIRRDKDLGLVP